MLKFSTFTGAHNNRETEGRKEIDGAISAQPDSAVVGEQLIVLSERRRAEKRRVSRGDTELHDTDFKGERMSVKKDTILHVEKIRRYMSLHVKYQSLSNVNLISQCCN